MAEQYLILHGWQNHRPEGHWQRWLAGELESRGAHVRYPQLPEPDAPVLEDWIDALEAGAARHRPAVAHRGRPQPRLPALAGVRQPGERAGGAPDPWHAASILVAPAAGTVLRGIPEIAAFAPTLDCAAARAALAGHGRRARHRGGRHDDPFCPEGAEHAYARPLDLDFVPVEGGGHLTIDDGYGPFPLVLDLATR